NTLTGNNLSNNTEGLRLTDSSLNTIFENEFDNSININESLNENFNQNSSGEAGLSNNWNRATEVCYLYNGGIYKSRFGNFYSDYEGSDSEAEG
uniref:NosD domain-containing protein n=1 Tax=Methanosarcina horonobensis TaxID=418008 RepID=UPI000B1C0A9D